MPSADRLIDRFLFWAPRVLCIFFAAFISLFALDVFTEGYAFWHTVFALLVHLIPTFLLVAVLIIAWRFEVIGGGLLLVLAAWYVMETWGRFPRSTVILIAGPLAVAGALFLCDSVYRSRLHPPLRR